MHTALPYFLKAPSTVTECSCQQCSTLREDLKLHQLQDYSQNSLLRSATQVALTYITVTQDQFNNFVCQASRQVCCEVPIFITTINSSFTCTCNMCVLDYFYRRCANILKASWRSSAWWSSLYQKSQVLETNWGPLAFLFYCQTQRSSTLPSTHLVWSSSSTSSTKPNLFLVPSHLIAKRKNQKRYMYTVYWEGAYVTNS